MPRARTLALTLVAGICLLSQAQAGFAQKQQAMNPTNREDERRSFAINLARAINSAEANYKKNHDTYTTWDNLLGNGDFTSSGTKWASDSFPTVGHALYGSGPEIVPGWKLRLLVSSKGNSYDLILEDVTDPKCGYAVSSDERGRIRQGKVVDCPM
jgi:hypothetical protein